MHDERLAGDIVCSPIRRFVTVGSCLRRQKHEWGERNGGGQQPQPHTQEVIQIRFLSSKIQWNQFKREQSSKDNKNSNFNEIEMSGVTKTTNLIIWLFKMKIFQGELHREDLQPLQVPGEDVPQQETEREQVQVALQTLVSPRQSRKGNICRKLFRSVYSLRKYSNS